jgi:hypothetical protein
LTGYNPEEYQELLPAFRASFQEHMEISTLVLHAQARSTKRKSQMKQVGGMPM